MQTNNYHNPVLKSEAIDGLKIIPDGIYVDTTFGGGGHSHAILKELSKKGKLIAFDQDDNALQNVPEDKRLLFLKQNFRYLKNNLHYHGYNQVDGILADLGVSSYQLNQQTRGFSFRFDSNLDMRMNIKARKTAADILNQYPKDQLTAVFKEYGEIHNASKLVSRIINYRKEEKLEKTNQLTSILADLVPKKTENQYLAKVFQALRIEVNAELQALKQMLMQSVDLLKTGGRLVIISYHSLEDRLVKNLFKTGNFEGKINKDFYGNYSTPLKVINNKVITPDKEEIRENNRARSAKLRIAEKR